jgi:hypothetical protein
VKKPFFGQEGAGSIPEKNKALFREFFFKNEEATPLLPLPARARFQIHISPAAARLCL